MTKQEIIEGNKLIAEFMNSPFLDKDDYAKQVNCPIDEMSNMPVCNCFYHSSWDRLMPVVDKIQKIYETKREFGVIIEITTTHIRISMKSFNYYIDKTSDDWIPFDIKILFKVVVEFIKWYNTQK